MTKTREMINQIIEARTRRQFNYAMAELFSRLANLEKAFEQREHISLEYLKYFPVALVACMEGYFRLSIQQLIDTGHTFLDNAATLIANLKFDFNIIQAFMGKQITIGEFISHHLPFSNLTHIQTQASILLGKDFLTELRTVCDRWEYEVLKKEKVPILIEPERIYAHVARTFELRHIICHELASNYKFNRDEIEQCFSSVVLFLKAANELFSETLHPGAPLTQIEMNRVATEEFNEKLKELDSLTKVISETIGPDRSKEFMQMDKVWRKFMKLQAEFEAKHFKGGSIWPLIYGNAATSIIQSRLTELKELMNRIYNIEIHILIK